VREGCGPGASGVGMAHARMKRSVQAIAEIAESRHDELVLVETAIDNRSVDGNVGMMAFDESDALRRRDDADDTDVGGAGGAQKIERRYGAPAGSQHRVDHEHETVLQAGGQLRVVLRGDGGNFIALEADVADARFRHQFEHGIEHAEPGAQHGNDDDVGRDFSTGRGTERCFHGDRPAPHFVHRMGRQQNADACGRAAETVRSRSLVAEIGERVVHERMIHDVDRHGPSLYNFCLMRARSACAAVIVLAAATLGASALRAPRFGGQADRRAVSLIVSGGIVVTEDGARRILNPGAVAIDGADIVDVDAPAAIAARYTAAESLDARDQIVLPGLVNTHTHAPMVMYRGLADDLALMDWLQKYIFPAEAKTVSPEMVRVGTRLAALEMIESGTTAYADMYYFEEEIAKATRDAGLRGVLGQTIIQFPVADAKTPAEGLKRAEAFIKAFRGDGLIVPAVAPHSMYTLDAAALKASAELARRYDVPVLIHLAETEDEVKIAREQHRMTPAGYLESIGFWGPRTVAAHGVWVTDEDIQLLRRRAVAVSHNPESNMKLASGTAPATKYLAAGVTLGLGTDGAASNNDLDMFEAMRQAALLAKLATRDPTALPAQTALDLATIGGAKSLGLESRVGSLERGKRADLIAVSVASARQTPLYDPVSHLVYATRGDDVRTTIVNGKVLMMNRQVRTLNRAAVIADANRLAQQVRAAVGR
jgi:5-methylthioadenosine/S-adenosylhomocysteine deaminase